MNVTINVTRQFNSVINYNCFFDNASMYPLFCFDNYDQKQEVIKFSLINFGLNINNEIENELKEYPLYFEDVLNCKYEFKSIVICDEAEITITGFKGFDVQLSNTKKFKSDKLYFTLPYCLEKGDYIFECGGYYFEDHFLIANIIAASDSKATITFPVDKYILLDTANSELEYNISQKQKVFKLKKLNKDLKLCSLYNSSPGKMFNINFINKFTNTCYSNGFNTTMSIANESFK